MHEPSGSVYRAISAEAYSKHGFNSALVVYDEVHCAVDRRLFDVLATSMGARRQPLMLAISTAGFDRQSILWELYTHAKKVQENPALDPSFLPVLYEAPVEADWRSERVWKKANPALGDFRSLEDMRIHCARAQAIPAQENTFRRLYLNQWTEQDSRWLQLPAWDACQRPQERSMLRGRRCYVGMDLSSTTDLTALVAVFPDEGGGFTVLPQFFVPQASIHERGRRDRVPYDEWRRQGHVIATTAHPTVDYDVVRDTLHAWSTEFKVEMVGFDPWNATDLAETAGAGRARLRAGAADLRRAVGADQVAGKGRARAATAARRASGAAVVCVERGGRERPGREPETVESEIRANASTASSR